MPREIGFEGAGGSWSTPALYGDVVFFSTAAGRVLEVDRGTGAVLHELEVGAPSIASPVVVDGVLILGDCLGDLYAWDVSDPSQLPRRCSGSMRFDGCIESTPAVWRGWLYLGTREGYLYGITDAEAPLGMMESAQFRKLRGRRLGIALSSRQRARAHRP